MSMYFEMSTDFYIFMIILPLTFDWLSCKSYPICHLLIFVLTNGISGEKWVVQWGRMETSLILVS